MECARALGGVPEVPTQPATRGGVCGRCPFRRTGGGVHDSWGGGGGGALLEGEGMRSGKFQSGGRAVTGDAKRLQGGYWRLEMRLGLVLGFGECVWGQIRAGVSGGGSPHPPQFKRFPGSGGGGGGAEHCRCPQYAFWLGQGLEAVRAKERAFCRPPRPVLLLVSFPRSRSPVVWCAGAVPDAAGCAVCAFAVPPPPPPAPDPKGASREKNEFIIGKIGSDHFWYTNVWVADRPPSPAPPSLRTRPRPVALERARRCRCRRQTGSLHLRAMAERRQRICAAAAAAAAPDAAEIDLWTAEMSGTAAQPRHVHLLRLTNFGIEDAEVRPLVCLPLRPPRPCHPEKM